MLGVVEDAVVILRRHGEAGCGAHGCAQAAEAAFGHVDVEFGGVQAFGHAVAGLAYGGG